MTHTSKSDFLLYLFRFEEKKNTLVQRSCEKKKKIRKHIKQSLC